jgi:hypothetical protein
VGATSVYTCDNSTLGDTGICKNDGSSNYVKTNLTYADGKFSGSITSNGCSAKPASHDMGGSNPSCEEQVSQDLC